MDASRVVHVMQGGLGASWHALIHDLPLANPRGRLTAFVLNQGSDPAFASIALAGTGDRLFVYQVEEKDLVEGMALVPKERLSPSARPRVLRLPTRSLTILTAFDLGPGDPGIVRDE